MELSQGNFDLVIWASDVLERRAALLAWVHIMPRHLEGFISQALAAQPVDVGLVVELREELEFCNANKESQ